MSDDVVVVVDLGGSSMTGALVTELGVSLDRVNRPTPEVAVLDALGDLFADLLLAAERLGRCVVGAAVVTPGTVDEVDGVVRFASNLHWRDMPLRQELSTRLGIPVAIGHDVRAAGIAEQLVGKGRGLDDILLIQIGTGVAAAIISGGRPVAGVGGAAGEFGHIPVRQGGERCTCGQDGCLEVYVSGAGVARRYAARGGAPLSSAEIARRVGSERIADEVWGDAVAALAQGIVSLTLLVDPALVVLGGGFLRSGETLLTPLRAAVAGGLAWRESPRLEVSSLGGDAGLVGAAALAYRSVGRGGILTGWSAVDAKRQEI